MDMDTITQEIKFAIDFCLLVVANHWNLGLFFCLSSADKITKYEKGETMGSMCTARKDNNWNLGFLLRMR